MGISIRMCYRLCRIWNQSLIRFGSLRCTCYSSCTRGCVCRHLISLARGSRTKNHLKWCRWWWCHHHVIGLTRCIDGLTSRTGLTGRWTGTTGLTLLLFSVKDGMTNYLTLLTGPPQSFLKRFKNCTLTCSSRTRYAWRSSSLSSSIVAVMMLSLVTSKELIFLKTTLDRFF